VIVHFIDVGGIVETVGAIVAVIVWWLDLQQPMQSVPITTDVDHGEVYNIM
jgi:hypothetical protein